MSAVSKKSGLPNWVITWAFMETDLRTHISSVGNRILVAETTMFRFKTIFGGNLSARQFDNQAVELLIKCAALNRMIQIAKPDSYEIEA